MHKAFFAGFFRKKPISGSLENPTFFLQKWPQMNYAPDYANRE
jgi:hypothetical protein